MILCPNCNRPFLGLERICHYCRTDAMAFYGNLYMQQLNLCRYYYQYIQHMQMYIQQQQQFIARTMTNKSKPHIVDRNNQTFPQTDQSSEEKAGTVSGRHGSILDRYGMEERLALPPQKNSGTYREDYLQNKQTLFPYNQGTQEQHNTNEAGAIGEDTVCEESAGVDEVRVVCYKCENNIPIYTDERPLYITCPGCGEEGKID